ncbi:MAG TPA: LptF/LptG family permease [Spirochaetia bacterium]|nr:LptF/LptG family permease [Spirochaetia bacterium]
MRSRHVTLYVAKEFLLSFVVAFLFFFFIFFVNQMLLMAEQVLTKRVGAWEVFLLIVYSLPAIVALSFPFASLVGALMAVGRFSSDNEIIAFQASGIPLTRLFVPIVFLGLAFSSVSFIMNDYFLPLGTINFTRLYRQLIYTNPELELESYAVKRYQDTVLVTGAVHNRTISNLLIIDRGDNKARRVITAAAANLVQDGQEASIISLNLDNVFSVSVPAGKPDQYDYFSSRRMVYNILLKNITLSIQNPTASEMSSVDLYALIQSEKLDLLSRQEDQRRQTSRLRLLLAQDYADFVRSLGNGTLSAAAKRRQELDQELQSVQTSAARRVDSRLLQINRLEFYKKFAIPFACVVFTIFAFPTALFTRRSGRVVGFGVGVLVSVVYWALLLGGITLGSQQNMSPFLAMWAPDFFFLLLGSTLFFIRMRR